VTGERVAFPFRYTFQVILPIKEASLMSSLPDVVVVQASPGMAVVECRGEHDLACCEAVADLLSELVCSNEVVVVDLSEAEFIDSSFVHCLLEADQRARQRDTRFTLQVGEAPAVGAALEHSGVLNVIGHATTREEAMGGP
jgi:anti-anti-sigma factor